MGRYLAGICLAMEINLRGKTHYGFLVNYKSHLIRMTKYATVARRWVANSPWTVHSLQLWQSLLIEIAAIQLETFSIELHEVFLFFHFCSTHLVRTAFQACFAAHSIQYTRKWIRKKKWLDKVGLAISLSLYCVALAQRRQQKCVQIIFSASCFARVRRCI